MSFIVIEGLDGSGKSTQLEMLVSFFKEKNKEIEYLHFPTNDSEIFGELISRFLRGEFGSIDNVNPYLVALLFAGDRYNLSKKIYQWLEAGKFVITDRYVYSNIAFQGAKLPNIEEKSKLADWIFNLEFEYFKIPKPHLSIFLNVPFDFTEKTLKNRRLGKEREYLEGKNDIHESDLSFQKNVFEMYNMIAEKNNELIKIDCFDSEKKMLKKEEILKKILEQIKIKEII